MRRALVAGNWKMNGSCAQLERLLDGMAAAMSDASAEVLVCPTYVYLSQALALLAGTEIAVGAQNCSTEAEGAHTGEVAANMLADLGCSHVIVGHSERRTLYGETDEVVAAKYVMALQAGLQPILCIGETLAEREDGEALAVVDRQLDAVFAAVHIDAAAVVAYEPVWAIGTGRTATPDQAQEVHAHIRARLVEQAGDAAEQIRVLYGGSVKADNAAELFAQSDIDGGLIGGASLKQEEFVAIVKAAS